MENYNVNMIDYNVSVVKIFPLLMATKVPLISALLVNEKLVTNFLEKTNILNDFFSQLCYPISNDSILLSKSTYCSNSILNDISFI